MTADPATLLGASIVGAVLLLVTAGVTFWWWRRRGDEMFVGVTPGLLPDDPAHAPRERLPGEWRGTVAVQFNPPGGAAPGTVGTVIDGVADTRDVSATIIDLAVRGWYTIAEVEVEQPPSTGRGKRTRKPRPQETEKDWELTRAAVAPADELVAFEKLLIDQLFTGRDVVRLSELAGDFAMTMREAQVGLYRDAVDRGWYRDHPRAKRSTLRKIGVFVGVPLSLVAVVVVGFDVVARHRLDLVPLGAGVVLATAVLLIWGSTRTPRTAEGTAARVQALGFRHYIETAEASQIRFEEAQSIFSRYLPYAMAFGLAAVWAKTFAEVAVLAHNAGWGDGLLELGWYDVLDLASHGDLISGVADVADLAGSFGDLGDGLSLAFDGLSATVDGLSDLMSSAGDLFGSVGDGCDLGGCDLGGCDF